MFNPSDFDVDTLIFSNIYWILYKEDYFEVKNNYTRFISKYDSFYYNLSKRTGEEKINIVNY